MSSNVEGRFIVEELQESFPALSNVYKVFGKASGKVSELEAALLVRMMQQNSDDEAIQSFVNKLLTYVKLTYNEEAIEFEKAVLRKASQRQQQAKAKEMFSQALDAAGMKHQQINRNIIMMTPAEIKIQKELEEAKEKARKAEAAGLVRGGAPNVFKDRVLNFFDKVNQSSCYELDGVEDIAELLETAYGLKLEKKGWLTPVYYFANKELAAVVRQQVVDHGLKK
ncbi:hypothetical protein D3C87_768560 [compost metagenome]